MRIRIAGQRFAESQFQRRKPFKPQFLRELDYAGLADARFSRQLLRAQMPRRIRLREQIIRQFPVALREIRITLANTNQTVHGQLLRNVMATTKRNFTRLGEYSIPSWTLIMN
ncbi:Uncharacterised protein [Salmonella enterica subsp. enterica serovar Typhimurium str. DT104]|nr:Uncharacterised protein [Salmonella enterica subsp. enterica serovar Typhimurium str. DT104]